MTHYHHTKETKKFCKLCKLNDKEKYLWSESVDLYDEFEDRFLNLSSKE